MANSITKEEITEHIKSQGEIVRNLKAEGAALEKVCTEHIMLWVYA